MDTPQAGLASPTVPSPNSPLVCSAALQWGVSWEESFSAPSEGQSIQLLGYKESVGHRGSLGGEWGEEPGVGQGDNGRGARCGAGGSTEGGRVEDPGVGQKSWAWGRGEGVEAQTGARHGAASRDRGMGCETEEREGAGRGTS